MKGKFLAKGVSAILTAMLALGLPSGAWAIGPNPPATGPGGTCTGCQVEDVTFETITPTAQIGYFTGADGARQAVALRFRQVGNEQRVYFSLLENETDIELFRQFARGEEMRDQSGTRGPGLAKRLPITIGIGWGSWISWNGNVLRLYVSHDLAQDMAINLAIGSAVCGVVAAVSAALGLPSALSAGICSILLGLSAGAIKYWDSKGAPGFYICVRLSPPGAWIEP